MKKFEYYKHLRSVGIKEEHAIAMVEQAIDRTQKESVLDAVYAFASWEETNEGVKFWSDVAHGLR